MNSVEPALPLRVALVGAGTVGTSIALLLARAGHAVVGVSSRTTSSAERAASILGSETFVFGSALPRCDLILLGAADAGIPEVAAALAPRVERDTYVCHFAGSLGIEPLETLRGGGARPIAMHPVQACPDVERAVRRLPGSAWGISADPSDGAWAAALIARDLAGDPVFVAGEDRPVWHAASVTVSNGVAALLGAGEELLASLGVAAPEAVLGPLAAGTVANALEAGGGARTLTGPVVRGEKEVVRRHLIELASRDPELAQLYRGVGETIVRVAARTGRISDAVARSLYELLEVA